MMDTYYDFTTAKTDLYKGYRGANGQKKSVFFQGERYMLKFQPVKNGIPSNSCISEYLGCHIFQSIGIPAQETLLGIYAGTPVVACKDFENQGKQLMEFAMLKNSLINSSQNGYGTELSDILSAIEDQELIPVQKLKEYFWNMFIVDAFLGNFDRHNGNWGMLVDSNRNEATIAPVYDCGSCLYPKPTDEQISQIVSSEKEINNRIYVFPTSEIKINNTKINYFDFISSLQNEDCTEALKRIAPRIDLSTIYEIVDQTPHLSNIRREFYKMMLQRRKEAIIDYTMRKLTNQ